MKFAIEPVEEDSKLDTIRKELEKVEELELITIPDAMIEAIESATNGDSDKIDAIRQFLDLEDEPASFFSEIENLKVKLAFGLKTLIMLLEIAEII